MVLPVGAADFSEALRWGVEVYHVLKGVLRSSGRSTAVGDEGGFAPDLPSSNAALEVLIEAIQRAGFSVPGDFLLGLDVAASELYRDGLYVLESEGRRFDADDFAGWLKELADAYPLVSIEDGMAEDDWRGWGGSVPRLGRHGPAGWGRPVRYANGHSRRGHRAAGRQRYSDQAQPGGHADGNAASGGRGRGGRIRGGDLASLGGKRPMPSSPIWRWVRRPPRSRPERPAAPTARRNTTVFSESPKPSAPMPHTPACAPFLPT